MLIPGFSEAGTGTARACRPCVVETEHQIITRKRTRTKQEDKNWNYPENFESKDAEDWR
jgi:hypothetical protein